LLELLALKNFFSRLDCFFEVHSHKYVDLPKQRNAKLEALLVL